MGKCVKCNAELIGSGKFCASCGAPVPEALRGPEPPSVTISGTPPPGPPPGGSSQAGGQPNPSQISVSPAPQSSGYEPPSNVNPFAATASPNSPVSRVRTDALAVGPISAGSAVISMSPSTSTPPDPLASTAKPDPVKPESSRLESAAAAPSAVIPSSAAASASGPPSVPNALGQTMDAKQLEAQFGSQPPPPASAARSPSRPPTPREGDPSQVSPLAVSNAISQRGAFQQAMESAREKASSVSPPAPPAQPKQPSQPGTPATPAARPNKKPGTQIMANAPNRPLPVPGAKPAEEKPAPAKAAPQRTVAMGFNAAAIMAKAQAAQQQAPGSVVAPAPSANQPPSVAASQAGMPPSVGQPVPGAPYSVGQPSSSQAQPPAQPSPMPHPGMHGSVGAPHAYPGAAAQPPPYANAAPAPHAPQPPAGPGGWGWSAPQQPPGYGYGFGYAPGSRVHVTWSNGQRYPATVSQVSGSQCLVVFPDGQQHWVEMQYLSPG